MPPEPETEPATEPPADTDPPEVDTDPLAKVRRESAGYRRRLRETEAERDRLAERVTAAQRAEVGRLAGGRLADAADLYRETDHSDLLDETGDVDPAKVEAAIVGVLEAHPHWRPAEPADFGGGARTTAPPQPDFSGALRRAAGGE